MCGIVGVVRKTTGGEARATVLEGLARPEYRGYDLAGITVIDASAANPKLHVAKEVRELAALRAALETRPLPPTTTVIGHTRWTTHGGVTRGNAHSHLSFDGKLALIHDGVTENADAYRAHLQAMSITTVSETDTEIAIHLLKRAFLVEPKPKGERGESVFPITATLRDIDPEDHHPPGATRPTRAMSRVMRGLEGPFTSLAVHEEASGVIVAARHSSPLMVGLGEDTSYLGSDVPAFAGKTKRAPEIGQDEIVVVTPAGVLVLDNRGHETLHMHGLGIFAAGLEN